MSAPSFLAHYDSLLAAHYTWMAGGDYGQIVADNRTLFERLGITPATTSKTRALDLGSGSGFQSAALLGLGYAVTSVDLCAALVDEARARNREAERAGRLTTFVGDLLDASLYLDQGPYEVVVCMGDTLTHLQSRQEVAHMIAGVSDVLVPGGQLVLRFRDLTGTLRGTDRFIPVRADADKIMTCFLEEDSASAEHVGVTDLIYSRRMDVSANEDRWGLEKSSYRKLRIDGETVKALLAAQDLHLTHGEAQRNLLTLVATAPRE